MGLRFIRIDQKYGSDLAWFRDGEGNDLCLKEANLKIRIRNLKKTGLSTRTEGYVLEAFEAIRAARSCDIEGLFPRILTRSKKC